LSATESDGVWDAIVLDETDDVAVALRDLPDGAAARVRIAGESVAVTLKDRIPAGHKLALRDLARNETARKYGEVIGRMSKDCAKGGHVHTHNLSSLRALGSSEASP
jgi:hypothetical protein